MRLKRSFPLALLFCLATTPLLAADDYARVYPQTGPAKVQSLIVTMKPGEETGPHRHGVPTYGYILEGQVTVDYGTHGKRTYRKGEAFMEAETVTHNGINDGDVPVRILVVFMGADGSQNVIHEK